MSSNFVLNWGIVSSGLISQDFCIALKTLDQKLHVLKAVAARNLEDAKKFANRFNVENYYDSYDKLFQNEQVNVVYIGSVNNTHKELCLKAINSGKHVLCEKPMTLNGKEQEEVLSAAKQKGVFFMEGLWTRFFPIIDKIKEEIKNGSIGEIKFVSSNFMVPIKNIERLKNKELGGGGILDIGIYPIQLVNYILDHEKPLKITASGHLMPTGVDETSTIILLYSNQKIAQINISTNCHMFGATYIVGEKGVIQIPEFSWCPTQAILPNGEKVSIPLPEAEKTNFFGSVGLRYEAEAVRQAIAQGLKEHSKVTHDNSRLIMHIMDEARKQLGCDI